MLMKDCVVLLLNILYPFLWSVNSYSLFMKANKWPRYNSVYWKQKHHLLLLLLLFVLLLSRCFQIFTVQNIIFVFKILYKRYSYFYFTYEKRIREVLYSSTQSVDDKADLKINCCHSKDNIIGVHCGQRFFFFEEVWTLTSSSHKLMEGMAFK